MATLDRTQIDRLSGVLAERGVQLREEIRRNLVEAGEARYSDLAGMVHDLADESVADMVTDFGSAMISRHIAELRRIDAARGRIANGSYGECAECSTEIGYERLLAQPTALRCIACQSQREKTHAHEETPRM